MENAISLLVVHLQVPSFAVVISNDWLFIVGRKPAANLAELLMMSQVG